MKTKIISTVVAFALMNAFSSCGTLQERGHFKYLKKIPVASADVKTVSNVMIDTCKINNTEKDNCFDMQSESVVVNNEEADTSAQTVSVKPEIHTHQTVPAIAEKVMETAEIMKPDFRSHRNTCSANAPIEKNNNRSLIVSILLIFGTLTGLAWLLWGWMAGVLIIGLLGPAVLIGVIVLALTSPKEKRIVNNRSGSTPVDTESVFIYESSPTGTPISSATETTNPMNDRKKSTPWGLIGLGVGVLLLTLCFGLGVLLLAFAFGIVAAVIASGIWIYNEVFSSKH